MIRCPFRNVWKISGIRYSIVAIFAGDKRLRIGKAVPIFAAECFPSHQLLKSSHSDIFRIRLGSGALSGYTSMSFTTKSESVPEVETFSRGTTGPAIVISRFEFIRRIGQHIRPAGREALIVHHMLSRHPRGYFDGIRNRLGRIADVFVESGGGILRIRIP